MVTCPYNPSHRIRKYKFMNHVAKCKKTASKTENKVECPLDRTHIVDRDYLKVYSNYYCNIFQILFSRLKDFFLFFFCFININFYSIL